MGVKFIILRVFFGLSESSTNNVFFFCFVFLQSARTSAFSTTKALENHQRTILASRPIK